MSGYSDTALTSIRQSGFLEASDWHYLESAAAELEDTWKKKQRWRTETEMRVSVLDDIRHPTRASKYWQAVREQAVFFEELVHLSFEYRRQVVKVTRLERDLATSDDELDTAMLEIDLEEARYILRQHMAAAKDRVRELRLWTRIKAELDDGSFDTTDPNTHQLESLSERFRRQARNLPLAHASPSEANNLLGQLMTAERLAKGDPD